MSMLVGVVAGMRVGMAVYRPVVMAVLVYMLAVVQVGMPGVVMVHVAVNRSIVVAMFMGVLAMVVAVLPLVGVGM
jgi:hypothetical protein